ncbi:MAG: hypothetical protein AAF799_13660 [Myxococcota bacterium]
MREAYELGIVAHHDSTLPGLQADARPPRRSPAELQYFVSDRLVLQREVTSRDDSLAHGRIRVRRGRYIEQIVIRQGTPGVAVKWDEKSIDISFEEGTSITFNLGPEEEGTHPQDVYRLHGTRNERGELEVAIEGKSYRVRAGHRARLRVRRDDKLKRTTKRRVMHGRKISEKRR